MKQKRITKRVVSIALTLAMAITALPNGELAYAAKASEKQVTKQAKAVNDSAPTDLKSPVCNADGTVTFQYYDASATAVYVAGSFTDWQSGKISMTKDAAGTGVWSCTVKDLTPGVYEYKFIIGEDNWITDPLAPVGASGNSIFTVAGLKVEDELQVEKGKQVQIPTQASLYVEGVTTSAVVPVTATLKATTGAGITLQDGMLSVTADCKEKSIPLMITDGTTTTEVSVSVVDKMYQYTIHYYSEDEKEYATRDLWIWEAGGKAYNKGFAFTETKGEADKAGRKWATATYSFPTKAINMIVRTSDWGYQEETRTIEIPEGKESAEVWICKDSPVVYTEWAEQFKKPEKRYILVEYDRPAKDYDDWNVYTWNSGSSLSKDISNFFENVNGKYISTIVVGESTSSIGYLIRKGTDDNGNWDKIIKDLEGDRSIQIPLDQKVVKVKVKQGSLESEALPYNKGYELDVNNKKINFYYRDDTLFREGTLTSLKKVQVEVDGQKYDMTYDAVNERYVYTLENPQEKVYEYSYAVTDKEDKTTEVLDLFNSNKNTAGTKSTVEYKDLQATVTAVVSSSAIDYNSNAVLSVSASAGNEKFVPTEAYADLTALGGKSKVIIDTTLMQVSIGVDQSVTAGEKEIPVTVVDQYNKKHTTTAKVTVNTRTKKDDFDWDEAVIYFMVTDRFKDGNAANNDAYGVKDYNLNGPSSYHGGDFAGVTEKLDYLKDLGINTIWVTPIVENILEDQHDDKTDTATYGYHGYWASNFEKLNKHLGTLEEFHTLIDEAHKRGIKIMVDVVLNHAGYGAEKTFEGMFRDKDVEGDDVLGSLAGLPDFATEKANVREQLVKWQTNWVSNLGKTANGNTIDYFRVDTVKHVDSTTWAQFKNELTKIAPTFKMIGEYSGASYVDDFGYLNSGLMDSLLDFGFNDMATNFVKGKINDIENTLEERNKVLGNVGTMGSFLSSHDEDGFKYSLTQLKDNNGKAIYTEEQADNFAKVAASLQMTAKGQVIVYYGEEIGLTGANNWPYQTNRYDMKFDNLTVAEQNMMTHYKKLLEIRNEYSKVLAKGTRRKVAGGDAEKYVAFERSYEGTNVVVGLNIADQEKTADLILADFRGQTVQDLYSGKVYEVSPNGQLTITIPAVKDGGTVILATKKSHVATVATKEDLDAAKALNKAASYRVLDNNNKEMATWEFAAEDLNKTKALKDTKLTAKLYAGSEVAAVKKILAKDTANDKGAVVQFTESGALATNATVRIHIAGKEGITSNAKAYVYRLNAVSGKLESFVDSETFVDEDGYVTMNLAVGGTYVVLAKKPNSSVVVSYTSAATAKLVKATLKKGKTTTMKVTLPTGCAKLTSLKDSAVEKLQSFQMGAKITYSTSKKSIATVSSAGKVTAKKAGKVKISAKIKYSDGTIKTITKTLKVTK